MKVLITGAFGTIGSSILEQLMVSKHQVTCFDIKNKKTKRAARRFKNKFRIIWGDIKDKKKLQNAVENQDIIIHLAFTLPPILDKEESKIREINIEGTNNILSLAKAQNKQPRVIFASSVSIFGDVRKKNQPIPLNSEPNPVDHYAKHKVHCMELVKQSSLEYVIFIIGFVVPIKRLTMDPKMFDVPIDTKIEVLHPKDIGKAFVKALDSKSIWNKTLHIGGGKYCRLDYWEFIRRSMKTMGIGEIPKELFGGELYHSAYLSSEESEKTLLYQEHSFEDILEDMYQNNKRLIVVIKIFRKLVLFVLKRKSPYYKRNIKKLEV